MCWSLHILLFCLMLKSTTAEDETSTCISYLDDSHSVNVTDDRYSGDVIFSFPYNFSNGVIIKENQCDEIKIKGNDIILQKNLTCSVPFFTCDLKCNTTSTKNTFRFLVQVVVNRPLKFDSIILNISESISVNEAIHDFGAEGHGAIKEDCYEYNQPIIYTLLSDGSSPFALRTGGKLFVTNPLDYEKKTSYILEVLAQHAGRNATAQLTINIEDVDDMDPEFDNQVYRLIVPEENSSIVGTFVPTTPRINATDRDLGAGKQNISYKFQNETKISEYFNINQSTGLIKIIKVLNREDWNQHFGPVIIKAVQQNTDIRSATATLIIEVTDVNDNLPKFNLKTYKTSLMEHASAGSYVTTVTATDKDEGENAVVQYNLTTYSNIFEINNRTGVILVLNPTLLDREANYTNNDKLMLTVDAVDYNNGTVGDSATVEVTLVDVNDHNPVFTQSDYTFPVSKNSNGSFVGQVIANDQDSGPNGNVSYSVTDFRITISSATGNISLAETLLKKIDFSVQACDQPHLGSRRCTFTRVHIILNGNTTIEYFQHGEVLENVHVSTSVMTIQAASDASMKFEMDENVNAFSIDENSGIIKTSEYLDREQKSNYTFPVYIYTAGRELLANVTVTIDVLDANDNAPKFTSLEYIFPRPDAVNKGIGPVEATDVDVGNNSAISYSIQNSLDAYYFQIDDKTGEIRLIHSIPESHDPLQLAVMATDHGEPPLSSIAQIYVTSTTVVKNSVKIKTPMTVEELEKQKDDLEKDIGKILNMSVSSAPHANSKSSTGSFLVITAKYKNGTTVEGDELQRKILRHMSQINALFSHQTSSKTVGSPSNDIGASEIALIVVAAVMLLGSIVAVVILFRKWDKQKRYIQLSEHMKRRSSLYESQELKLKIDDETSDYNGSLNTQEEDGENTGNGDVVRGHAVTAYVNGAYEETELKASLQNNECAGEAVIQSSRSTEAINEAIASLDNLTKELNAEDNHLGESNDQQPFEEVKPDYNPYENEVTDQHQEIVQENIDLTSRDNIDPITGLTVPEVPEANLDGLQEHAHAYANIDILNEMSVDEDNKIDNSDEEEPQPDYNVKGVRFSAQVLDTVENKFEPLKAEKESKNESKENDIKENIDDSDDKDGDFVNDKYGDETDRVDEEIRSPLPTIKSEDNFGNVEDTGTFHFGISNKDEEKESTQF